MQIKTLLSSAAALTLLISAENLNAMKKGTGTVGKDPEDKNIQVTTTPVKLEEKVA